jgi:hypothetical protein
MTDSRPPFDRESGEIPEETDLRWLVERMEDERPIPDPGFRGELRRRLFAAPAPPRRVRLLIAAYACSGLVLLAVATIGVAGAGPLAAG